MDILLCTLLESSNTDWTGHVLFSECSGGDEVSLSTPERGVCCRLMYQSDSIKDKGTRSEIILTYYLNDS